MAQHQGTNATEQGRSRDEQGSGSDRGDVGAAVLLISVQRHFGPRQTVQGQVLGLDAVEDRALDRWGEEGQLQMPAQTTGGDAGVLGQPAEIRALTQSAEPAMRTDQCTNPASGPAAALTRRSPPLLRHHGGRGRRQGSGSVRRSRARPAPGCRALRQRRRTSEA